MSQSKPGTHLHVVNVDTGEDLGDCPTCVEWGKKYNGVLSQLGALRADKDAEARANGKWPTALSIFRYWQDRTGHDTAQFTGDRFWLLEPHLTRAEKRGEDGAAPCRSAIRGLCASEYHMKIGREANRPGPRYDEFWRPFKTSAQSPYASQDQLERWMAMDPDRNADPTESQVTLILHAKKVAERVLERAKLIETETDSVACAHLLIEIDRLTYNWRMTPLKADG